jgi:hypothetical protein
MVEAKFLILIREEVTRTITLFRNFSFLITSNCSRRPQSGINMLNCRTLCASFDNDTTKKGFKAPMLPAQSVRRLASDDPVVQGVEASLPIAEFVTEIHDQPTQMQAHNGPPEVCAFQVEVVPDYARDGFDTPSTHSYVTEDNQAVNDNLLIVNSITGDELLRRLKGHRKKATMRSGIIGGVIGMIFLGPLGAVGIGFGSACYTKSRLKRREKSVREQLKGRLDQPLQVLSSPRPHCRYQSG